MKKIMIIEDLKLHQKKIKDVILELGYEVSAIFDYAEKAVDYIFAGNDLPDLIIIDINLKGAMNGYQAAKKISSKTDIPFIILSARKDEIQDFEASVYLNKPFSSQELKNNVELALYKSDIYKKMLKNNEEKRMILDTIDTQIWYLTDSETYGKVNQAHADFIGLDKSDIENQKLTKFLSEKEFDICIVGNQKVFKEKKKIITEEWLKNKDGETRLIAITKNPKLDQDGKVEYVVCSAEDITAQYEKEKIIRDLHKIAIDFKELTNEREICKKAVKAAENILDFNLCNIVLLKGKELISYASSGDFEQEKISISKKSIAAKTLHESKSFIIDDLQNNMEAAEVKNIYKSAISIPIGSLGVFQAAAAEKNSFFKSDLELAEILISHVIAALDRISAQQKIQEQKDFLSTILEVQSGLVLLLDSKGEIVYFNKSCQKLTGYSEAEVKGKKIWDLFIKKYEKEQFKNGFNELKNKDYPNKYENYWLTKTGEKKQISWSNNVILDNEDKIKYIVGTGIDISQRKEQEEKLKEQKAYFEQLFNNSPEAIALLDNQNQVMKANEKFEQLFGFKESEMINQDIDKFILPEESLKKGKKYTEKVIKGEEVKAEVLRKAKNGKRIELFVQAFPIKLADGQIGIYALYNDITERKKKEKQIEYLSFHDEMTGLYNRRYFENELKRLDSSRKYPITIVLGDLDGLKYINDNYGHRKGDEYIINTADILKKAARAEDVIARIGGDEYAIILPSTNHEEAQAFCQRIKANITEFNNTRNQVRTLSISLGFEVMENNSQCIDEIFKKADQKMYINKRK
ncbi:MAG: PAS domain S-box protein [Bacillota bacterium]